ncbi:MAG: diguanylate cyclase [Gammaproteobacteria bacterium]|nr:diguanylate cyclase [Gammaproteobacteria bacterium]
MSYCEKFGFDAAGRSALLATMELAERDHVHAQLLQQLVVVPQASSIVDAFYAWMLKRPAVAAIIEGRFDPARLKRSQIEYLLSLGINFHTEEYFERRLRVGLAHAGAGVPLGLTQAGFRLMEQLLIDHIPTDRIDAPTRDTLIAFVIKIAALDFALTIESYHNAQVRSLEKSVQSLRREGGRLYRQATIDVLTGVATRRHVIEVLQKGLRLAQLNGRPLSLILLDVDFFKQINDRHGHSVGDRALRGIAARIKGAVREADEVGRYGGEEFVAVLPDTPLAIACEIAERVRDRVASAPIHCEGRMLNVTISLGLAQAAAKDSVDGLIARADGALYCAKKQGRNRSMVEQEGRYRSARSKTSAVRARLRPQIETVASDELSAARAEKGQRPLS